MPNDFLESDLQFTFPDDWIVRKFDDTAAYRSLSGHGLKGVDFLCLTPEKELWLIEVKNYRIRSNGIYSPRRNPEALGTHVGIKFRDTKRLIRIMNRAMRQRWWVAIQLWWQGLSKRSHPNSHYWFWAEADRLVGHPRQVVCLLWLETPETNTDYEEATAEALTEWLEPGNRLQVLEMQGERKSPLIVSELPFDA